MHVKQKYVTVQLSRCTHVLKWTILNTRMSVWDGSIILLLKLPSFGHESDSLQHLNLWIGKWKKRPMGIVSSLSACLTQLLFHSRTLNLTVSLFCFFGGFFSSWPSPCTQCCQLVNGVERDENPALFSFASNLIPHICNLVLQRKWEST